MLVVERSLLRSPLGTGTFPTPYSCQSSECEQSRTYGLFLRERHRTKLVESGFSAKSKPDGCGPCGLSTTCAAKKAPSPPSDSNGTNFALPRDRQHARARTGRIRRAEDQTSPTRNTQHAPRATNRLSKSNGPSPRRNFEPQTSSWELKACRATSFSVFQRADALRRQFGKTDGLQHPNLRTQTLCVNRGNVFFKSVAPTGNRL